MQSIQIIYDEASGGINVNAPTNLVVALGMLEAAKAAVIKRATEPAPTIAVVPGAVLGNNGRN